MNDTDIEKIVRWAVDSDIKTFAEDAYGITGTAFDEMRDEYLVDKFITMQLNFIRWVASLSENNRDRLARNITLKDKEAVDDGWIRDTVVKDGKTVIQGEIIIKTKGVDNE